MKGSSGVPFYFILLGVNVIFDGLKQKMNTKLYIKLIKQIMNNCVLYTRKPLNAKMNKSTLGTKTPKAIDRPQLGHGFTSVVCSGGLERYSLFEDLYHNRFYYLMQLILQWQLIKIPF